MTNAPRLPRSMQRDKCESCGRITHLKQTDTVILCDICIESGVEQLIQHLFNKFESGEVKVGLFGRFKYKPIVLSAYRHWLKHRKKEQANIKANINILKIKEYLKRITGG